MPRYNREVGEAIYIDGLPPIKATVTKVSLFVWGLHTVRREDMDVDTTANEQAIVNEEYALYMRQLYKETLIQGNKGEKDMIATVDNLMDEKGPYSVKALPNNARSRRDVQTFTRPSWEEALAKIKELGATGVLPSRFYEQLACLKDGAPPAAVDYERLYHHREDI